MARKPKVVDKPWSRQPRESEEAYAAFIRYRDLGSDRSIDKVSASLRGDDKPSGKRAGGGLFKWSASHNWSERARAWDNELQTRRDDAAVRYVVQWELRRLQTLDQAWEDAQELRNKLKTMLSFPVAKIVQSEDGKTHIHPAQWTYSTVAAFAKIIAELEIAVLKAVEVPLESMTDAEVRAIHQVHLDYMAKQADDETRAISSP